MQRLLDIFFSSIAIIILFPLLLPIMLILRFSGEGEVFYVQQRIGYKGVQFGVFKFATMLKNSPNIGAGEITLKEDPRVLPVGGFLRRSKLNELPQLWNIFIGDMSIVGPRPMVQNTFEYYSESSRLKLNTVRPGLTGIGSIFFRDEEDYLRKKVDPSKFYREHIIPYKGELEVWFVENQSLRLYIKVIAVTAWVVIFPSSMVFDFAFRNLPKKPAILQK